MKNINEKSRIGKYLMFTKVEISLFSIKSFPTHISVEKYFYLDTNILVCWAISSASYYFFFLFITTVYDEFGSFYFSDYLDYSWFRDDNYFFFVLNAVILSSILS